MIEENNIEFTFNDFNDYAKELADIKATYDDLINDKEIQGLLKLKQENRRITEQYLGAVADYETVMSEKKQLQDNWDDLKKYIQNEYKRLHGILETPAEFEMMALLKVFDKMRELEQGSDSNDSNR